MLKIKPDSSLVVYILRFIDFSMVSLSLGCLAALLGVEWAERYTIMSVFGGGGFLLAAQYVGMYTNWRARSLSAAFSNIWIAWVWVWAFLIVLAYLYQDAQYFERRLLVAWAVSVPFLMITSRVTLRWYMHRLVVHSGFHKRIAIAGAGKVGIHLSGVLTELTWLGNRVVAFYDDNPSLFGDQVVGISVRGDLDSLVKDVKAQLYDEVYICLPLGAASRLKSLLDGLTNSTVVVKFIPDLFSFDLLHARLTNLKGIPVISVYDSPLSSTFAKFVKRVEDVIFSSLILLAVSPIFLILAIGVKLTSPGPVFYRQSRVGWNGVKFDMYKFRSMPVDVETKGIQWGGGSSKANSNFGRFIRRTSLDELPQFLNVLKGDMSIVGPRPERDVFVDKFREEIPRYMQKHMVKAGITGWAQVNGWRGDTSLEKRIEYDLHYINEWSLWLDIRIIILTCFKGFVNENAK